MSKYPDRFHSVPHALISTGQPDVCPLRAYHICIGGGLTNSAVTWVTANRAYYMPMLLERGVTITGLGWENGGVVSGIGEAGWYTWEGKRLITTGRQTQTPINEIQLTDTPDTYIPPGCYFLAMVMDNTTAQIMREGIITTAQSLRAEHQQIQDLGVGGVLPAQATFANPTAAFFPLIFASTIGAV